MVQGRITPTKTKAKVIAMKLSNPDTSNREIAKKVWIDSSTVNDIVNIDIPQLPSIDERMSKLLEWHIKIQEKIQAIKLKRIDTAEEDRWDTVLDNWDSTSFKTSQLLQGKATDRTEHIVTSPEEQERLLNLLK